MAEKREISPDLCHLDLSKIIKISVNNSSILFLKISTEHAYFDSTHRGAQIEGVQ